jgi:hypothetical protein
LVLGDKLWFKAAVTVGDFYRQFAEFTLELLAVGAGTGVEPAKPFPTERF